MKNIKRIFQGLLVLAIILLLIGFWLIPRLFQAKYEGPTMTTRDGKKLVTIVHLPEGDGSFPTLIVRSPYDLSHAPLSGMRPIDYTGISGAKNRYKYHLSWRCQCFFC